MKTKTPKRNIKLFNRIKEHILEEPRRLNMAYYGFRVDDPLINGECLTENFPPCGTVGCISGWAQIISAPKGKKEQVAYDLFHQSHIRSRTNGAELLGVLKDEAVALFYVDSWPEKYQRMLADTTVGTKAYARVVVRRIDHFLKTAE